MAIIQYITPTQPSGSIDGVTYYKNGGQIAMRARVRPTVKASNARTLALNSISVLSMFWEMPLTNSDRIGWQIYAVNTPLTNAWNAPRTICGYAHYMRSNRPRYLAGLPRVDTPPSTFGLPTYTTPTITQIGPPGNYFVNVTSSDAWATDDGAYLFGWISQPLSPARTRPPEIYRQFIIVPGSSTTPPTSVPFTLPPGISPDGSDYFVRWSVSDSEGRLSGV